MTSTWLLYAFLVGLVLTAAALLAERGARLLGWPARWIWASTLPATMATPFLVPLLFGGPGTAAGSALPPALLSGETGTSAVGAADPGLIQTVVEGARAILEPADPLVVPLWAGSSVVALVLLAGGARWIARRRREWRPAEVDGHHVLRSEEFGPAIVGALHPVIVIPAWAFALPEATLRTALLHEAEHARRRDPLLLLAGAVSVALMPWNLAMWWQLRRLRQAVEADCDLRVLARGVSPARYGKVLLEVRHRVSGSALPSLALVESAPQLTRRLKMITEGPTPHARLRGVLALIGAVLLGAAACESPVPPEVVRELRSDLGLSDADARADGAVFGTSTPVFYVDGGRVEDPASLDLSPERIERIEVRKPGGAGLDAKWPARGETHVFLEDPVTAGEEPRGAAEPATDLEDPIVYIDGERVERSRSELEKSLEELDIARIHVLRGAAAEKASGDDGRTVIRITTKR